MEEARLLAEAEWENSALFGRDGYVKFLEYDCQGNEITKFEGLLSEHPLYRKRESFNESLADFKQFLNKHERFPKEAGSKYCYSIYNADNLEEANEFRLAEWFYEHITKAKKEHRWKCIIEAIADVETEGDFKNFVESARDWLSLDDNKQSYFFN